LGLQLFQRSFSEPHLIQGHHHVQLSFLDLLLDLISDISQLHSIQVRGSLQSFLSVLVDFQFFPELTGF
jgi:hypothetical protein